VKPNTAGVNLHSIWDKALGAAANPGHSTLRNPNCRRNRNELDRITRHKTRIMEQESRAVAIESCYLRGDLKGSKAAPAAPPLQMVIHEI